MYASEKTREKACSGHGERKKMSKSIYISTIKQHGYQCCMLCTSLELCLRMQMRRIQQKCQNERYGEKKSEKEIEKTNEHRRLRERKRDRNGNRTRAIDCGRRTRIVYLRVKRDTITANGEMDNSIDSIFAVCCYFFVLLVRVQHQAPHSPHSNEMSLYMHKYTCSWCFW